MSLHSQACYKLSLAQRGKTWWEEGWEEGGQGRGQNGEEMGQEVDGIGLEGGGFGGSAHRILTTSPGPIHLHDISGAVDLGTGHSGCWGFH